MEKRLDFLGRVVGTDRIELLQGTIDRRGKEEKRDSTVNDITNSTYLTERIPTCGLRVNKHQALAIISRSQPGAGGIRIPSLKVSLALLWAVPIAQRTLTSPSVIRSKGLCYTKKALKHSITTHSSACQTRQLALVFVLRLSNSLAFSSTSTTLLSNSAKLNTLWHSESNLPGRSADNTNIESSSDIIRF